MDGLTLTISIILCAVLVTLLALTFLPFYARWSAYRHSALIRIDLPTRLEKTVSARLMARDRGAGIGGLVFLVAAIIITSAGNGLNGDPTLSFWFVTGAAIVGTSVGTAVAALVGRPDVASDTTRVARSGVAAVADYLVPLELIGARVVVVLSVVATVVTAVLAGSVDSVFPISFFTALGAASLVFFEVASRRIVDVSQPAGSTGELVWDDAVRASSLRDLLVAPLILGTYSLIVVVAALLSDTVDPDAETVNSALGIGAPLLIIAVSLYSRASRPQRYFITRLWPDLRWSDTADTVTNAA